jgi:aryl-alcohol dehydrogenase-like predicted oxidoreductase
MKMQYRVLGRTGLKVSELGCGGHEYRRPLPTTLGRWGEIDEDAFQRTQPARTRLIEASIAAGVNYFDATQPEEAKSLGHALAALGRRREVHVAIMSLRPLSRMAETPRTTWRRLLVSDVEKTLALLQSDYADVLNVHMPERGYSPARLTAAVAAFEELKVQGRIRYLGASSHAPRFLAELLRRYDCFDTVMVRYNYHLQDARDVLFPVCKAFDVGVVVMKPLTWPYYGIPFTRFGPVVDDAGPYTPIQACLRWILAASEVATVVPGMNSVDELEENLGAIVPIETVDDRVLDRYLHAATGPDGPAKLAALRADAAVDVRYFAERASGPR